MTALQTLYCPAQRAWRVLVLCGLLTSTAAAQLAPGLPSMPTPWPAATPPPAAAPTPNPSELLPALLEHSRSTLVMKDGRLQGPALASLRELAAVSHFVMLGEDHGSRGIAEFATALWNELATMGWRYAAIETDPWVAQALETRLRRSRQDWTRFLVEQGGVTAPFFAWDAEVDYAAAVLRTATEHKQDPPVLWGLDQVFIGAAPWLFERLAQEAGTPALREQARALADRSRNNIQGLANVTADELHSLAQGMRRAQPTSPAVPLVEAMLLSRRIYSPFTGGPGEALIANQERETLMKRGFAAMLQAAEARDGQLPRVMLKFGASHMYRGPSPTWTLGLGGFVSELAVLRGTQALNLLVLCGPGSEQVTFDGRSVPCGESYNGDWAFLAPYIDADAVTVFDLRSWRFRPRRFAHLSAAVQRAVGAFDFIVFPPRGKGSAYLPEVKAPQRPQ